MVCGGGGCVVLWRSKTTVSRIAAPQPFQPPPSSPKNKKSSASEFVALFALKIQNAYFSTLKG
jgi:hypothetical protein